jgi:hypothetical protein
MSHAILPRSLGGEKRNLRLPPAKWHFRGPIALDGSANVQLH